MFLSRKVNSSVIALGLTHQPFHLFLLKILILKTKGRHAQYTHIKLLRILVQIMNREVIERSLIQVAPKNPKV